MVDLSYRLYPVRTAAILTGTYVASPVNYGDSGKDVKQVNQLVLLVDFTIGDLDSAEIKVEFSADGTNWYQEVVESATAGVIAVYAAERSLASTGKYRIPVKIKDRFVRVSAKGTGTATSSSMAIGAVIGIS